MEPPHRRHTTAKTTLHDLPTDCWKLILSKLQTPHIASLSLTSKHLLSITNTIPLSLTLTPPLLLHLTTLLLPLLRRFSASLHTISIHSSPATATAVDAALCFILSSITTAAPLCCIHLRDLDSLPLKGLRHLGLSSFGIKVLTLCNIPGLCDQQLVALCIDFPLLEEIDVSLNSLSDEGILGLAQKLELLRKINLSGNLLITDQSLIALSDYCFELSEVVVFGCKALTQNGIGYVMRHSAKLSRISINTLNQSRFEEAESLYSLENSIGFCRNLSNIEMYTMNMEDALLRSIAKANLPLTQFTASYTHDSSSSSERSSSGLSTLLCAYPMLERLNISGEAHLTDEAMKGFVSHMGNLVVINISYCYELTTSTFQMLLENCRVIEEIDMPCTHLGKGELDEPLVKRNTIKCLKLDANRFLTDKMLEQIGLICPNLEHLGVSSCENVTGEGIRKVLKWCRELRHLEMAGCRQSPIFGMGFEGTMRLNLESINLVGAKLDEVCISAMAKACSKILNVNLAHCEGVTSKSVKELVECCPHLRELNLERCYNASPQTLAWIVSARPYLRTLTSPHQPQHSQRH